MAIHADVKRVGFKPSLSKLKRRLRTGGGVFNAEWTGPIWFSIIEI